MAIVSGLFDGLFGRLLGPRKGAVVSVIRLSLYTMLLGGDPAWMRIGAYANPTTCVVTGLRQINLRPVPAMGAVANIPLGLCFVVSAGFAVLGMNMALRAFKKAIK
jgi:uncharacterized membrane protein